MVVQHKKDALFTTKINEDTHEKNDIFNTLLTHKFL